MRQILAKQVFACASPANAAELLYARIGKTLADLFFRPYTRKMWGMELEELDSSVVKRVPLRLDDDDRYFPDDRFQLLPERGYTAIFRNILDHDRIRVSLETAFDHSFLPGYSHCFNSMAIDEYFDEALGPLRYRSIRFFHREERADYARGTAAVVNFTDNGPYTRDPTGVGCPGTKVQLAARRSRSNGPATIATTRTNDTIR